jgi:P-type E1-E2 ATPase
VTRVGASPSSWARRSFGASDPKSVERLLAALLARGETTAVLVVDGELRAVLGFSDELRPSSRPAIDALRRQGIEVMIFSGDNPAAVARVARELHVERARGAMTPQAKAEAIAQLLQSGHTVAMVGDGVNDAPALTRAHVGMAMGGGADVAIEAADCTILRADPSRVPLLIELGRGTLPSCASTWRAFGTTWLRCRPPPERSNLLGWSTRRPCPPRRALSSLRAQLARDQPRAA